MNMQNGGFKLRPKKPSKFGAKKTGGYDSKKECQRAAQLRSMQANGLITGLQEQVPYTLLPSQKGPDGKTIERPVLYYADFTYRLPDGTLVVEDTKGVRTPEYIIKRKMMLYFHRIRITET